MDLEEVWKIRRDRFRFFWEEIYKRFWINRLWWEQAEGQVVRTLPVSKNRIREGSAAIADTISGSPGRQAQLSANAKPGSTLSRTLRLPQRSSLSIWTRPVSTSPMKWITSPAWKMISPFSYSFSSVSRHCNMASISSGATSLNKGAFSSSLRSIFSPFVVKTTYICK